MRIVVSNSDQEDLYVTVWDLNTADENQVLNGFRLNIRATQDIQIIADGNGRGKVRWRAANANDTTLYAERVRADLNEFDEIHASTT